MYKRSKQKCIKGFFMKGNCVYIVAGDCMLEKFNKLYPNLFAIPFREDFSKGQYKEPLFSDDFINKRCIVHNTTEGDYISKLSPIIHLDFKKEYVLCFGEDECCQANLKFMIEYLKKNNYKHKIKVNILNEDSLELIKEYCL
jgi:hypothetical protein